ncbi:hypothetical protein [Zoogloea sp.]|uniref:hypothetical protein n=1 Tax=Zoogloea sp. TaxID=49181 RepID=UPI0025E0E05B|nr:hypothetical protein [Zoogloea sp.]MCK6393439.1 hypothetical protein [Zoogloea sp.]
MRGRLWVFLLVLNLGLAWGVGALWLDEDLDPKNVTWREPVVIAPAADSLAVRSVRPLLNDLSQFNSTGERPLFWVSRRPPPPPSPEKPAAEQEPDPLADIRLVGLMEGGGESGVIALTGGRFRRVMVGQPLGAWTLDGVEGKVARFRGAGGDVRNLEMKHARQGDADLLAQGEGGGASGGPRIVGSDGKSRTVDEAIAERRARKAALLARTKRPPEQ